MPHAFAKYRRFALQSYVEDNCKIKWCPVARCNDAIAALEDDLTDVECSWLHSSAGSVLVRGTILSSAHLLKNGLIFITMRRAKTGKLYTLNRVQSVDCKYTKTAAANT